MNTLGNSSSAAESGMDDNGSDGSLPLHQTHLQQQPTKVNSSANKGQSRRTGADDGEGKVIATDGSAGEVWRSFTDNFREVQSVLDRNRLLIQQVNENHQSKIRDNMVKNVALIQEINGNISKVVTLYSDLSVNFSSVFHHSKEGEDGKSNSSSYEYDEAAMQD